jgi:hypothetical protein
MNKQAERSGARQGYGVFVVIFFLAVAACGFCQLALFRHPPKWDLLDQAFPWKYFIGECLQNHLLPLWNPYQHCGYPIHADPQSSAWYLPVWIIGFLFGYNVYTVSIDFVLHIFLAGLGMYLLGRKLNFGRGVALLMGTGYMLSGFFVGNAQHFMWIISATWLPYVISSYLGLCRELTTRNALLFALFTFLLVTGGYPAFTFILLYFLVILFIFYLIRYIRERQFPEMKRFLLLNGAALLLTILLSAVVIVSVAHLLPYMSRAGGLSLSEALYGAFTPRSFLSFLLPYAVARGDMSWFGTDLSMANAYFGLVLAGFFLYGWFVRKPGLLWIFLAWGMLTLLAAAGGTLPFREFLYRHAPLMNIFRFPSLFRIFTILSFIVVAGYAADRVMTEWDNHRKKLAGAFLILAVIIILITIPIIQGKYLDLGSIIRDDLFTFSGTSTLARQVFFQGIVQLVFIGMLLFILFRVRNGLRAASWFLLLLLADMVLAAWLNAPYSVYYEKAKQSDVRAIFKTLPDDFPLPDNRPVILNNDSGKGRLSPMWRNLNIYLKQPAWDGYNPLHLKAYEQLEDEHPRFLRAALGNTPAFLAAKVLPIDSLPADDSKQVLSPATVYADESVSGSLTSPDTATVQTDSVLITRFIPGKITLQAVTKNERLLVLLQNNYYGWKVNVNGRPSPLITVNTTFMGVKLPAGSSSVEFSYRPRDVVAAFYVSVVSLALLLAFLIRSLQGTVHKNPGEPEA